MGPIGLIKRWGRRIRYQICHAFTSQPLSLVLLGFRNHPNLQSWIWLSRGEDRPLTGVRGDREDLAVGSEEYLWCVARIQFKLYLGKHGIKGK